MASTDSTSLPWQELTGLTQGRDFVVERVRLRDNGVAIEGAFDLPPLAQLTAEDQVFVAAFLRTHGSIKEMERLFGVSYPTIKSRLSRIAEKMQFAEVDPPPSKSEILGRLERGELTVQEALEELKK